LAPEELLFPRPFCVSRNLSANRYHFAGLRLNRITSQALHRFEIMPVFTPHQDQALNAVATWLKDEPSGSRAIFRLFGYAGTGKTTLARHLAENVDGKVLFAAFTGKAAQVMRNKGCHGASTIHSLIYRARESGEDVPNFELWDDAPASKAALIIIDECSMVDAELGRDLMSFGVPVLVLGDPAQLPPIQSGANGAGFFTESEPDAMLTEVHRQAQDDPIVRLSMDIREGRAIEPFRDGETQVVARSDLDPQRVLEADQVLVGRNATRRSYNARLRERRGITDPLPGRGRPAGVPAQQPQERIVQRRTLARQRARRAQVRRDEPAHPSGRRQRQGDQGFGAAGMLYRRDRGFRMAAAQAV
jgi:ATP-dependent exoDNAse (exonuclease V) alpha subunit